MLISIAAVAMATMRRTDVFGRIAGGQFGLLLPETDAEEARDAVERIRRPSSSIRSFETPGERLDSRPP